MATKKNKIKNIAVLCSGGDAPGMNCAIRSVVRTAISKNLNIFSIYRGYSGILEGNFKKMDLSSVGNIIQHGGTIIGSSRCPEFLKKSVRKEAAHILRRNNIDALVVIGGNGSFQGAMKLHKEEKFPVVGIPGTIDNDISGLDYTIGLDSAVRNATEAVDKIRDTATSHDRTFLVEVMGRHSPAIAVHVGICSGAENVILGPQDVNYSQIIKDNLRGHQRGKKSSIIIVSEGGEPGHSYKIQKNLKEKYDIDTHVCVLGHLQRGGSPSAYDRYVASQMGYIAVVSLLKDTKPMVAGHINGKVTLIPLSKCLTNKKFDIKDELNLIKTLAI